MRLESETAAILKKRPWLKLEPGYIRAVRTEHSLDADNKGVHGLRRI